jgi:hypothetical protein
MDEARTRMSVQALLTTRETQVTRKPVRRSNTPPHAIKDRNNSSPVLCQCAWRGIWTRTAQHWLAAATVVINGGFSSDKGRTQTTQPNEQMINKQKKWKYTAPSMPINWGLMETLDFSFDQKDLISSKCVLQKRKYIKWMNFFEKFRFANLVLFIFYVIHPKKLLMSQEKNPTFPRVPKFQASTVEARTMINDVITRPSEYLAQIIRSFFIRTFTDDQLPGNFFFFAHAEVNCVCHIPSNYR